MIANFLIAFVNLSLLPVLYILWTMAMHTGKAAKARQDAGKPPTSDGCFFLVTFPLACGIVAFYLAEVIAVVLTAVQS